MNAPDIELGQQLTDFKGATKNLDTCLRGHRISSNKFIRSIHNSFTRRIDHLNADLCLENDYDDANSRAKKKASLAKARRKSGRGERAALEYGYHFIAYVPCDGLVWELDGLRNKPQEIGQEHRVTSTSQLRHLSDMCLYRSYKRERLDHRC